MWGLKKYVGGGKNMWVGGDGGTRRGGERRGGQRKGGGGVEETCGGVKKT